jgi:alpha-beta hydrolase superfamily lysophospholipase
MAFRGDRRRGGTNGRARPFFSLGLALGAVALMLAGCGGSLQSFEKKTLNPGLRSNATPADLGVPFERVSIPSGSRRLDGFLVRADAACPQTGAVLIFHGRNETIADWTKGQKALRDRCISSLAFDYSGHGRSSPGGTVEHLNADSIAAYGAFLKTFPATEPRCLLSHSMGGGPLLYAAVQASKAPDCVVLASPFSSLRAMAIAGGLPKPLGFLMPDVWNNARAAAALRSPVLWLHSQTDTTIPIASGRTVYDAKTEPKTALVLRGFNHNAIYDKAPAEIWSPIAAFVLQAPPA